MALFRIPEILVVDSIRGAEIWKSWIQNYNIYESASEIEVKSQKIQIATFLNIIGQEGIDIYNSFDDSEIEELIDGKTKKNKRKIPIKHRSTEDVNFVHTKNIEKQHKYSNNYKIDEKLKISMITGNVQDVI